jgi:hypothetical protein
MAASLSATIAFGLGATTMVKLESAGTGVTRDHVTQRVDNFAFNDAAGMLFLDVSGLGCVGWVGLGGTWFDFNDVLCSSCFIC